MPPCRPGAAAAESRRRYAGEGKVLAGGKAAGGAAGEGEAGGEERRRTLAKTVEQLRSLVEAGGGWVGAGGAWTECILAEGQKRLKFLGWCRV